MALCTVQYFANALDRWTTMSVILPDGEGPFPVLYLLHGLSRDHAAWLRLTSLERYAIGLPLIIAMPDGDNSWYCNDHRPPGRLYEDHIVGDVVGFVDRTFRTVPDRAARAIGGPSMGGYGAMMLAFRHPDVFSVVGAHSSAVQFAHEPFEFIPEVNGFAETLPKGEYDVFVQAELFKQSGAELAIRFDCGDKDPLLESNRDFDSRLDELGIPHEYVENPGAHSWEYFDAHVKDTLAFVMAHVAGAKA